MQSRNKESDNTDENVSKGMRLIVQAMDAGACMEQYSLETGILSGKDRMITLF